MRFHCLMGKPLQSNFNAPRQRIHSPHQHWPNLPSICATSRLARYLQAASCAMAHGHEPCKYPYYLSSNRRARTLTAPGSPLLVPYDPTVRPSSARGTDIRQLLRILFTTTCDLTGIVERIISGLSRSNRFLSQVSSSQRCPRERLGPLCSPTNSTTAPMTSRGKSHLSGRDSLGKQTGRMVGWLARPVRPGTRFNLTPCWNGCSPKLPQAA